MRDETAAKIATLQEWVGESRAGVAFTGAGISTESGIPDFRSPGGFWTKHKPIMFDDFLRDPAMRRETWKRKFSMDPVFREAKPNIGHRVLAQLVATGRLTHIITQNVDNLHQVSGVPDQQIIELHGNGSYARCLECGDRHELAWIRERLKADFTAPDCKACGGTLKTATISFGQSMPTDQMARAHEATRSCDLFISIGSSLVVYPAAGFPVLAKQEGARLVILNRDPTELDQIADLVINAEIGDVLKRFHNQGLH